MWVDVEPDFDKNICGSRYKNCKLICAEWCMWLNIWIGFHEYSGIGCRLFFILEYNIDKFRVKCWDWLNVGF